MFFIGEKLKKSFNNFIKIIQIKFFDKIIIFASSLMIVDKFSKFDIEEQILNSYEEKLLPLDKIQQGQFLEFKTSPLGLERQTPK